MSGTVIGALIFFFLLAAGVFLILLITVPFSVFGIKDMLKELKDETAKTNRLLEEMLKKSLPEDKKEGEKDGGGR